MRIDIRIRDALDNEWVKTLDATEDLTLWETVIPFLEQGKTIILQGVHDDSDLVDVSAAAGS